MTKKRYWGNTQRKKTTNIYFINEISNILTSRAVCRLVCSIEIIQIESMNDTVLQQHSSAYKKSQEYVHNCGNKIKKKKHYKVAASIRISLDVDSKCKM